MRLLPQSLFGRLMLVLASGLIGAQLLSAALNLAERDSLLVRAGGMQHAQRIADIVSLLDSLDSAERGKIVRILNAPPLVVSLDRPLVSKDAAEEGSAAHATMFSAVLQAALGDDRPLRVTKSSGFPALTGVGRGARMRDPSAMGGPMAGRGPGPYSEGGLPLLVQVRLNDGTWATFDTQLPKDAATLPWRLLLTLVILLAATLLLSYIAVRWVTRPLHALTVAADELGRDINRPPLAEKGPTDVRRAARAFNNMQARLIRVIEERTRLLTAMSHDLKTPITRMRLRAEMLEDHSLRDKFESDLGEMEAMVTETLLFMRGLSGREPKQPIDVVGLLESIQGDNETMGRSVNIDGRASQPVMGNPGLLKRCVSNLVDNAVLYGQEADIRVEEDTAQLTIRVRDRGPGIPEQELEAVFEPFVRLEGSRNRETGGTGLGLSIARNIARAHGGEVRLVNRVSGGLEAVLTLPWKPSIDGVGA
jgi:signal transduction histidine kinase